MRASELMIGDLVLTLESTHKEKVYAQIWAIEEGQTSILVKKDNCNWFVDIEWIEPIPLTPEILEKNFEKKTFYGIYDDYFDLDIREYSDGLYIVTYHSCEFNIPVQTIHLSWVHELQHFMRHCGIEKEITI